MNNPVFWIVALIAAVAAFLAIERTGVISGITERVVAPQGEYAYRCADGTEFSMTPSEDATSITLYPATNVGRIQKTVLNFVESEFGTRFEASLEGLVFHGQGERVQLIGRSFSTTCTPVTSGDNAPYNWGD
jgi:hypothetical protein